MSSIFNLSNMNEDFLLHRNLDVNLDFYCNELQKEIKRLPPSLRSIKELIYDFLLPKVESVIADLEDVKKTTNYDENVPIIGLSNLVETNSAITSIDCFNNHNIKSKSDSKIIYGTATGELNVFDYEANRNVVSEKGVFKTRIEIIKTTTVKFYDSYISRIVVYARGNPNINIYSYNHSYSSMCLDETIKLSTYLNSNDKDKITDKKAVSNKVVLEESLTLDIIPCKISISKDSFFMVITNHNNTSFIFKFNDIPNPSSDKVGSFEEKPDINKKLSVLNSSNLNLTNNNASLISNNDPFIKLVGIVEMSKIDNYNVLSVIPLSNPNATDTFDKNKDKDKKLPDNKDKSKQTNKKNAKDKTNTKDKGKNQVQSNPIDELVDQEEEQIELDPLKYNVKNEFDDKGNDCSALQKLNDNVCFVEFIQKKIISDDGENQGFSSVLITSGIYFSYYNTSEVKYFSLIEHYNKQMKNVFKINKVKGGGALNEEELFSMKSKLSKQEKDLYAYIKKKIETQPISQPINVKANVKEIKDKSTVDKKLNVNKLENETSDNTDSFTFFTISRVSTVSYPFKYNKNFNYVSLGLMNGCILIWDCELHSDKYYLETSSKNEITNICLNQGFCVSASIDGRVFIHDLLTSDLVYECLNNPTMNYPITTVSYIFIRL